MIFGLFIHYFIGATYFLKGDFVYKFSYDTMDVEKGFPKNLKRYFIKCPRQKCEFYKKIISKFLYAFKNNLNN